MANSVTVTYNGTKFRRYPDSENTADRTYYKPGQGDRLKGVQALHQEVWKDANGVDSIPEGFHVHHADHDTENNEPANLVLINGSEHIRHHMRTPERVAMSREAIKLAQEAAKAWHASPEGLAWHREHARTSIMARPVLVMACDVCGTEYESKGNGRDRFCSNNCKSAARRKSGVDDVERICAWCGVAFFVNKYAKAQCCSKSCGMKRSRQQRAQDAAP